LYKILYFLLLLSVTLLSDGINLTSQEKEYLDTKKVIKMCVDPDWEPFEIINKSGVHEGIAADLIKLVQKRLDIKIILVPTMSWEETLEKSKKYECDIMSFLNKTPKREEWLTFTEPIFRDPNVLVGRAENKYIEDLSKVKASIALPYGTAMSELVAKDFPNLTIIPTTTENEAFKLVEEKKADLTLRSMIVAAYTIKKEGLFNLKIIGQPQGYENKLRIGVRKDEPILRDILNKGIETITEDDTQNIINRHVTVIIEKVTHITLGFWIALGLVFISLLVVLWNYTLRKKVALEVAKNLQQQEMMFQQNKQAEVGSLVGNIAHQWRDGLNNISSVNLEIMTKLNFGYDITKDEMEQYSSKIEKSISFMSDTMKIFLDFYKPSSKVGTFNATDSIRETCSIIDMKIKQNNVKINISEQTPCILNGIRNEWMHVWLNLINNAINVAMARDISEPVINITINENIILFEDNCGKIDESVLDNIKKGNYKGLGLKMSTTILNKYGWKININNTDQGALFEIYN